jgi:hypothetical protein
MDGAGPGIFRAMDREPLLEIQATLQGLGLDEHLDRAIRFRLRQILGSPFAPPPAKKPAVRKMIKPPETSQSTGTRCLPCARLIGAAA